MQQNKQSKMRRTAVRLLLLVAALFALSPTASAWYVRGYFVKAGDTDNYSTLWNNGEDMGSNNSYTFGTVTSNKTIYFKLADYRENGNKFYGGHKEWTFPENGGSYGVKSDGNNIDNVSQLMIDMKPGKLYTISFDGSNVKLKVADIPYLTGKFNGWNETALAFSGNPLTAEVKNYSNGTGSDAGFKVKSGGSWYGGDTNISSGSNVSVSTSNNNNMTLANAENVDVTFTLTLDDNGKPSKISPKWNTGGGTGGGSEGDYEHNPGTGWAIIGHWNGFGEDWTKGDAMTSNKTYSIVAKDNSDIYFRVKNGSTEYYPSGSDNKKLVTGNYEWCTEVSTTDNDKAFYFTPKQGYKYEVVVESSGDNTAGYRICVNDKGVYVPPVPQILPVFPIGVYNEAELESYTEWPVYYLQADVLNNYRVTPEYQMEKQADGTYALEVTMRNTDKIYVAGFASASEEATKYAETNFNGIANQDSNIAYTFGRKYKVVFDPNANNGKGSLTFTDLGQNLPFLSMIGKYWRQNTVANGNKPYLTPCPHKDSGETDVAEENREYRDKYRDTDFGWQEAWIQYDKHGNILKDRSEGGGKVMYATMWPPKETIKFKTDFTLNGELYDFTIESDGLTFVPYANGEKKKGSEWKKHPIFKKYEDKTANPTSGFNETEYTGKLVLDDDKEYVLYRAEGMWINGDVKLWSGWGGLATGGGRYDSKWFANWGHYKGADTTVDITPESTVPLWNEKGDIKFKEPTYFRYVDFFYAVDGPQVSQNSVFFAELALGGAEIAAMSRDNYTKGMYRPRLTNISNVADKKVMSVVIVPWTADNTESFPAVFTYNGEGNYTARDFINIFKDDKTHSGMDGNNGNWWVYDETKYTTGDYRYKMSVVLEGTDEPIKVESNLFTIYRDQRITTVAAYQLVEVKDANKWVTYAAKQGDTAYEVVEETVDGTTQFTVEELEKVPNYADGSKYLFSDQVLVVSNPINLNASDVLGYYFTTDPTLTDADFSDKEIQTKSDRLKGRFAKRVSSELGNKTYRVKMKYNNTFYAQGTEENPGGWTTVERTSEEGIVDFALTVPTPKVDAKLEVFYGKDNANTQESNTDTKTFNYTYTKGGVAVTGTALEIANARYHQVREYINIEAPNATTGLKNALSNYNKSAFTYSYDGVDLNSDNLTEGLNVGKSHQPSVFYEANFGTKFVTLNIPANVSVFNRWGDGTIKHLKVSDDGPNQVMKFIDKNSANGYVRFHYAQKDQGSVKANDLIETVYPVIKFYTGMENSVYNTAKHGNSTYELHRWQTGVNEKNEPVYDGYSANDYYHVIFLEKGTDGKLRPIPVLNYDHSLDKDDNDQPLTSETVDLQPQGAYYEYILSHNDLKAGKKVALNFNFGHWWDGQAASALKHSENICMDVSILHPFHAEVATSAVATVAPAMKAAGDVDHGKFAQEVISNTQDHSQNVIKTQAYRILPGEISTSIEGIEGVSESSVKAGVGFIEVAGNGVEIYSAEGIKVAVGEGRHDLNAGVYVVRVSGRTQKVIVR